VVIAAIAGIMTFRSSPSPAPASVVATTAPAPERVLVRLVVVHPGARTVQAAGDFNGWNPSQTPLEPVSNGAWTVTIPLEPGRYEYQFVVDGEQWIADPFAVEQNDDGFGSRNAVLDVRPVGAAL
jgi:1,4-alpha-glucan branching enzyme